MVTPVRTGRPVVRAVAAPVRASAANGGDRRVAAQAAALAASPSPSVASATTAWAPHPPSPRSPRSTSPSPSPWLSEAVRCAVKGIDEAPFLIVPAFSAGGGGEATTFVRHPVSPAVVAAPALWPGIAAVVAEAAGCGSEPPAALMLVHPLAEGGAAAAPTTTRGGGLPLAGLASPSSHSSSHHLRLADTSTLLRAGLATAELAGRVGEPCCDEEEEEAASASLPSASSAFDHPAHPASSVEPGVAYYGVVVLSGGQGEKWAGGGGPVGSTSADAGCYVLKTVRSPSACGCACVYFTLTRVVRGEPLASQLASSWLA